MRQANRLVIVSICAAVLLLAAGSYLKSSLAEQSGKIDFALVSHNKSSSLISEARVQFEGGGASWGYIDPGGGAVYSDHGLRLPPTKAVISWEVVGVRKEFAIKVPALPLQANSEDHIDLVFEMYDDRALARWDFWSLPKTHAD